MSVCGKLFLMLKSKITMLNLVPTIYRQDLTAHFGYNTICKSHFQAMTWKWCYCWISSWLENGIISKMHHQVWTVCSLYHSPPTKFAGLITHTEFRLQLIWYEWLMNLQLLTYIYLKLPNLANYYFGLLCHGQILC